MGSGYGGALAAWAKIQHKTRYSAAWASSAPIEAMFGGLDENVPLSLGADCSAALHSVISMAEGVLREGGKSADDLMGMFRGLKLADADFLHVSGCLVVCVAFSGL